MNLRLICIFYLTLPTKYGIIRSMKRSSLQFLGKNQLIDRLAEQVGSRNAAITILKKRGQVDSDGNLTPAGQKRDNMTAEQRAKDRAAKRSKRRRPSDFKYDPRTNKATLRK
jgi:hypothetical protein